MDSATAMLDSHKTDHGADQCKSTRKAGLAGIVFLGPWPNAEKLYESTRQFSASSKVRQHLVEGQETLEAQIIVVLSSAIFDCRGADRQMEIAIQRCLQQRLEVFENSRSVSCQPGVYVLVKSSPQTPLQCAVFFMPWKPKFG